MTDQEIVDGLINRDEKITDWFFNIKYRPLFINVIKLIFDYQVDYDECISELYYHLMKNDAAVLRHFEGRSTIGTWIKIVAIRFFREQKKREQMIEDESKEPLYEQNHEEEIDDSESKIAAKIDLERLFDLMSNKRYVMVIRELVLKEVEPEFLALSIGITVANLYNIKKRALAANSEGNLCDFQCEQFILKRRKIEYNSDELSEEARNNSWLRERGTPLHSVGRLLERRGLIVMRSYGSSIDSVIRALKAGHDAIVVVNSCRLPGNSEEEIAYHAAVVLDVNEEEVTLYDPAAGEESTAYPKDHFIAAWNDAKAYLARVKVPDLDYNPRPIDLEDVELSTDLIELREAIAENAHEVWADQRQEEGWTYGPQRDDEKKETPDMVPYSMLPYSEKEYDRRMAFDTIKLMKKLGYSIIKRGDTALHNELMRKLKNEGDAKVCECGASIFMDQIYCSHCGKKIDWKLFR